MREKTDMIKNVLDTMISISGRKTSPGDAIIVMETVLRELEQSYDFLKNVHIQDTRFTEDTHLVRVLNALNAVDSDDLGHALHDIVTTMTKSLGKNAGYYFIRELQKRLNDEDISMMNDMGVDLGLLQLEFSVLKF